MLPPPKLGTLQSSLPPPDARYRLQSLLPHPELATSSGARSRLRACCLLRSLLPPPKLAASSEACCLLRSLLPPPELSTASRACYYLQQNPDLKQGQHTLNIPASRLPELGEPERHMAAFTPPFPAGVSSENCGANAGRTSAPPPTSRLDFGMTRYARQSLKPSEPQHTFGLLRMGQAFGH